MNNGFKLIEEKYISEIEGHGRLYIHEKSGARLLHIENNDDNKVFSISFRTPPVDNTGLTHILEHSVLSGSRKFPTKEPFVDLAKGSLSTFLNALTFADKTMYPVASKNEKDLFNLMDVYMDAVFYPNIYKYKEIFMQEGWHYDINSPEEEITYKGVVYNEMLGAFSSPEEILFTKIMETLYPDTCYGLESGGNPDYITRLSYEDFLEYHKKYYHPSNSYIYLYGNGDLDKVLKFLDNNYLVNFDKIDIASAPKMQKNFINRVESTINYSVSSKEEEQDATYISLNYVIGDAKDVELLMGLDILEYILMETPASPLKKALIDSGIGRDVMGNFDEGLLQPMFNIVLKDSNPDEKDNFLRIVDETLKGLVMDGIDCKLIEAALNSLEFKFREANGDDTPKGLLYGIRCMDSWLYTEDPFLQLEFEKVLNSIKEKSKQGYFEKLIEEGLINNSHSSLVTLIPMAGLSEESALSMKEELRLFKESLSQEELSRLISDNIRLRERQITPDREEDLEKIPVVSLKDISREVTMPPMDIREEAETKVLYHNVNTNRIIYFNLLFDTSGVSKELLPYIALLSDVLGMVSTKKYSYGELSNEIDIHTGGISFDIEAYEEIDTNKFHPKFVVETKFLRDKFPQLIELLDEMLNKSKLNSKKRLLEIIRETKSDIETELIDEGDGVAVKRLCSYFSDYGRYIEILTGINYYNFIADIEVDFNKRYGEVSKNLREVAKIIFNKANLITSIVCDEEDYRQIIGIYKCLVDKLNDDGDNGQSYSFESAIKNEGIFNSSNVQFVAKGCNYRDLGYSYSGYLQVLKNVISLDYLWNRVRVQGGAYGAFCRFEMGGNVYFVSYRDPNLSNTLEIYRGISDYLENFEISDREMEKYIIGTISSLDQPLTPPQIGQRADEMYFRNITKDIVQREREQILSIDKYKLRELAPMVKEIMGQDYICVVGNEATIKDNDKYFQRLYNVFDNK